MERTCLLEKSEEQKMGEGDGSIYTRFFPSTLDDENMVWTWSSWWL